MNKEFDFEKAMEIIKAKIDIDITKVKPRKYTFTKCIFMITSNGNGKLNILGKKL